MLTLRNWLVGAGIVEFEQNGEDRAAYGKALLPRLAEELRRSGRRGLGVSNLKNCRQVALAWPGLDIRQTMSGVFGDPAAPESFRQTASGEFPREGQAAESIPAALAGWSFPSLDQRFREAPRLPWQNQDWFRRLFSALSFSHLLDLSRIEDPLKRAFYELECLRSGWSVRELKRQRDSLLYERTGLSRDKGAVLAIAREGRFVETPASVLRDPYVLEFLGLEERPAWTESELERALLDHLQQFLHELGHEFCFIGRQYRLTVGGRHHYLDLLFYHRGLRCLFAVDLKIGAFRHEDAGQMHFYLNYLAENLARADENPPVGLVLCTDKDVAEVHYATAGLPHSVFVSRYLVHLPSEEKLQRWLQEERALLETQPAEDEDGCQ
jgi:predicted nuclease of restriction endonuclease-like (RecB) superfamily